MKRGGALRPSQQVHCATDVPHPVTLTDNTVLQAAPGNLTSDLEEETVILNVDDGIYYGMNPVAAFVWRRLENRSTFQEVFESVMAEFEVDEETCRRDLTLLLTNLVEAGLVQLTRKAA